MSTNEETYMVFYYPDDSTRRVFFTSDPAAWLAARPGDEITVKVTKIERTVTETER